MMSIPQNRLPEQLLKDLAGYIAQHYAPEHLKNVSSCVLSSRTKSKRTEPCAQEMFESAAPACVTKCDTLENILAHLDAGFSETLLHLIDERNEKDSDVYRRAGLSKQHFSKIRNDPHYRPTKPTAIALALALKLDVAQTNDLIGRSGFTLSNSSKFDLIIRYFIERKEFDIVQINLALYEFDQPLLGG